jgi:hypothetical protein
MNYRKMHFISGIMITIFVGIHLFNHTWSVLGAEKHIEMMNVLRLFYRHIFSESILFIAVILQIWSGITLFKRSIKNTLLTVEKLRLWTGLYLAIFFIIHLSAILFGRFILHLDTNLYFGVAGINTFPYNLFFIPYYALAILSFFGHLASVHHQKMKRTILSVSPRQQSISIIVFSIGLTFVIFFGLTNHFHGIKIPPAYHKLIGK